MEPALRSAEENLLRFRKDASYVQPSTSKTRELRHGDTPFRAMDVVAGRL